jgi:hypothetical protein
VSAWSFWGQAGRPSSMGIRDEMGSGWCLLLVGVWTGFGVCRCRSCGVRSYISFMVSLMRSRWCIKWGHKNMSW